MGSLGRIVDRAARRSNFEAPLSVEPVSLVGAKLTGGWGVKSLHQLSKLTAKAPVIFAMGP